LLGLSLIVAVFQHSIHQHLIDDLSLGMLAKCIGQGGGCSFVTELTGCIAIHTTVKRLPVLPENSLVTGSSHTFAPIDLLHFSAHLVSFPELDRHPFVSAIPFSSRYFSHIMSIS
jgi:hypothetical protein